MTVSPKDLRKQKEAILKAVFKYVPSKTDFNKLNFKFVNLSLKVDRQKQEIIDAVFKYLHQNFATKDEFDELKAKVDTLPTKDEFFKEMAKVMKELKDMREDKSVLVHQVASIKDRMDAVEQKLAFT